MKISVGPKTILQPHPVLVIGTFGKDGKPNLMTASWGGICCSEPPCISISLRKATLTYHNILETKSFTVNIPSESQFELSDYCGLVSGRDTDKFAACKLTPIKSDLVNAPYPAEFPYCLECKLLQHIELGLHTVFIGEIQDLKADEATIGEKKLPDIEKVKPILFGSFGSPYYYGIGPRIGKAFNRSGPPF